MTSRTLRRRIHHGDLDGRRKEHLSDLDDLDAPLLGYEHNSSHSEAHLHGELWDEDRKKEQLHWMYLFSQLIAQWAQWLANIILGSRSFIGRFLSFPPAIYYWQTERILQHTFSPLQEERLRTLRSRLAVPFNGSLVEHQDALKQLWGLAYPVRELPSLKSEAWKDMGWQGSDPSTDFRGAGFISLENLIFFAKEYPEAFQSLLHKQDGHRSDWEYPFAVAGVNISFMLAQMLDIQSGNPTSAVAVRFLELLGEDEAAFDRLYCVAFQVLDAQWLAKGASYMDFKDVLESMRTQLERELVLEDVLTVKDLPAYNLLRKPGPQNLSDSTCYQWI